MKALVGAFYQEKALVGAFSVIVQPVVEPMDRFAALVVVCCPQAGERTGYYSYLSPGGGTVLVRYTAGRGGFRVLESSGVPGLATFGPAYSR